MYASKNLHNYNSGWLIRERCRARADYEVYDRTMQILLNEANRTLAVRDQIFAEQNTLIKELKALQNY